MKMAGRDLSAAIVFGLAAIFVTMLLLSLLLEGAL